MVCRLPRREVLTRESGMKVIILLVGLLAMATLTGCEEGWEHGHRGGGYDHDYYNGYGHGYAYPNSPYQGYPNYDDGYHH